LKVNAKRKEAKSSHPDRDEQFQHIDQQRRAFQSAGQPVISMNWAGKLLRAFETVVGYIRSTVTATGLAVKAVLKRGEYETGERVTDQEMKSLHLKRHDTCPAWNYAPFPAATRHATP
jgi:hypothetical protein